MVTINSAENALKSVYLGAITEILNTKTNPLLAMIEKTTSDVWGKEIRKAVRVGLSGGIGAGDEAGPLPKAGADNYLQYVATLKNLYGQIEISDKAIRASANDKGAFADLLNSELNSLITASKFNFGRMLYGDGSGKLATTVCGAEDGSIIISSTKNLIPGLIVDFYRLGECIKSGVKITAVDDIQNIIYTDGGNLETIGEEDEIYIQGSKDKEITGLGSIFGSNNMLYGIDRNTCVNLQPYSTTAEAFNEVTVQQAIDRCEMIANSTINFIAISDDVKYSFMDYMAQYKRNIDMMNLESGVKTMSFNGIPLVYDRFVPEKTMYLLDTTKFHLHQLCDWRYLETENGNILRQNQGYPTYTATLVKYCELICDVPNGQAKIVFGE